MNWNNTRAASLLRRIVNDQHDASTVFQTPNLPAIVFLVARVISIPLHGTAAHVFETIAFGAGFVWAWQELFDGDSLFRRCLGAIVLVALLFAAVS